MDTFFSDVENSVLIYRILIILLFAGFLPLCTFTFYNYRLRQRKGEIKRILHILNISKKEQELYSFDMTPHHYAIAVVFAMGISIIGLSALLLSTELHLGEYPNLLLSASLISSNQICSELDLIEYQQGALLAFGLGFMGAYLWGLQSIFRRYMMNDLIPATFFRFGIRMIFSSIIALLIYHIVGGFDASEEAIQGIITTKDGLLLLTLFMVGMFPQRGIKWMTAQVHILSTEQHPSVRVLPLEMIEGITAFDKERLEELGIDSCYDLATADFIPLFIKTPYCSRELIDWILQAKLCVKFADGIVVLRQQGFRRITDLEDLNDDVMEQLAKDTSLTLSALQRAKRKNESDHNIARLKKAAELLGQYWEGEEENKKEEHKKKQ